MRIANIHEVGMGKPKRLLYPLEDILNTENIVFYTNRTTSLLTSYFGMKPGDRQSIISKSQGVTAPLAHLIIYIVFRVYKSGYGRYVKVPKFLALKPPFTGFILGF